MRLWEDESYGVKYPLVVIEPGARAYSDGNTREQLAEVIADILHTTPDKLSWYELAPNGDMTKCRFQPYETEQRPYTGDLSRQDYEEAEKKSFLAPDVLTAYREHTRSVNPEEKRNLQLELDDPLESFEQKQSREFKGVDFAHSREL